MTSRNIEGFPSWRATDTIATCLEFAGRMQNRVTILYTRREALHQPHLLANWARNQKTSTVIDFI